MDGYLGDLGSFASGFVNYNEVTEDKKSDFAATVGELAELLSQLNGLLKLE